MNDFYKQLSISVRAWCDFQDHQREQQRSLQRREHEIHWYSGEISKLREKCKRKPSARKQLEHYQHELKRLELEIAFLHNDTHD